jgi:hypothetical protein
MFRVATRRRRTYPVNASGRVGKVISLAMRTKFVTDIDKVKTKAAFGKPRTFNA